MRLALLHNAALKGAISLYCLWSARDLLAAWQGSLFERHGWLVLALWLLPLLVSAATRPKEEKSGLSGQTALLAGALFCTFAGTLASLHLLQHVGLALALAAWAPPSALRVLWLASALAWMPALSWMSAAIAPKLPLPLRLTLAGATSLMLCRHLIDQQAHRP